MRVLLSIRPQFVSQIFCGAKRFEFRRKLFASSDISEVVVYATKPIGQVVGEFRIKRILSASPLSIWRKTWRYSGISRSEFFAYFDGTRTGHAIEIEAPILYRKPLALEQVYAGSAPQSFAYLDGNGHLRPGSASARSGRSAC